MRLPKGTDDGEVTVDSTRAFLANYMREFQ